MAARTPGAASMKSAASVGRSVGKAAKLLLRGREEDLGIDAVGNMVSSNPFPSPERLLLRAAQQPAAENNRKQVVCGSRPWRSILSDERCADDLAAERLPLC